MQSASELAPPGAGVPWPHGIAIRYIVRPFIAQTARWEASEARFRKVTAKLERELTPLTPDQLDTRVLIPSQFGLEDSSRNWSIAMTLDHIQIVGRHVLQIVQLLDAGEVPDEKADTAKVKPSGLSSVAEDLTNFRDFCDNAFPKLLPALHNKRSGTRFAHPWFGPMTARGWYWLLAEHHALHLKQIRAIRASLPSLR